MIDEADLRALLPASTAPLPPRWRKTATGERMPDVVAAVRRSRDAR